MDRLHSISLLGSCALVGLLGASPLSHAAIVSMSGDITTSAIPSSLVANAAENSQMVVYSEKQELVLAADVFVNFASAGSYFPVTPTDAATIPIGSGTKVSSFLFHLDPPDTAEARIRAAVTFDAPILGIITLFPSLTATDALLGAAGTTYESVFTSRGMEPPGSAVLSDTLNVSGDLRTLNLDFGATALDEIRVLVAASDGLIPVPGTLALIGLGLAGVGLMRLRKVA